MESKLRFYSIDLGARGGPRSAVPPPAYSFSNTHFHMQNMQKVRSALFSSTSKRPRNTHPNMHNMQKPLKPPQARTSVDRQAEVPRGTLVQPSSLKTPVGEAV
jgi:hypothetical protein